MSHARDLPARPSLDSLRKQAKRLARDAAAGNAAGGNADAIARVQAQLPRAVFPLSNRDAQLVVAREYGFAGWPDLTAEVQKRLGHALDSAASQAKVAIHDQDNERLRALLAEYPALVSWRDESGQTLFSSTTPYALDVSDPERERIYTRPVAAEMLIDAGITVEPSTWEYLIDAGAAAMLHVLARKHVLPPTLPVLAARGDHDGVRSRLEDSKDSSNRITIARALGNACRFKHTGIAVRLLERAIALEPDLGRRVDGWHGRQAFVDFLMQHPAAATEKPETTLWQQFVIRQLTFAQDTDDRSAFRQWLEDEPWVLQVPFVHLQAAWISRAAYGKRKESFITTLLEHDPALLRIHPAPPSSAIIWALSYGNGQLVPMLTRIWPLPDDLPHAAGTGNAAAVARWFDTTGQPVLGPLANHYPGSDPQFPRRDLGWGPPNVQEVLDIALAWAALNHHFEIASFLLDRGADINTNWSTHEPASILHEAAINGNEPAVRFLIDHGADLAMEDYRYHATAEGWARYGSRDERMADLLAAAAARRASGRS